MLAVLEACYYTHTQSLTHPYNVKASLCARALDTPSPMPSGVSLSMSLPTLSSNAPSPWLHAAPLLPPSPPPRAP